MGERTGRGNSRPTWRVLTELRRGGGGSSPPCAKSRATVSVGCAQSRPHAPVVRKHSGKAAFGQPAAARHTASKINSTENAVAIQPRTQRRSAGAAEGRGDWVPRKGGCGKGIDGLGRGGHLCTDGEPVLGPVLVDLEPLDLEFSLRVRRGEISRAARAPEKLARRKDRGIGSGGSSGSTSDAHPHPRTDSTRLVAPACSLLCWGVAAVGDGF